MSLSISRKRVARLFTASVLFSGASLGQSIVYTPCTGPEPQVVKPVCGSLTLPLKAGDPSHGTIGIGFRLYAPTAGSGGGTIVPRQGGPGIASTAPQFRNRTLAVFAPLRNQGYSVLYVDQRGRGTSGAINCPTLQNGAPDVLAGISECGASLGITAGDYSSAAAAADLEAVRAAVGIGKIDLYGQSYAGVDVDAYVTRYPQNVRSIVVDSPYTTLADFFSTKSDDSFLRAVRVSCTLNEGCAPRLEKVYDLINRLRAQPYADVGYDLTGTATPVQANETAVLISILGNIGLGSAGAFQEFLNQGEIGAAATAYLEHGDAVPLNRLLAENAVVLQPAPGGPVGNISVGDLYATECADIGNAPWVWAAPQPVRELQFRSALNRLPREAIAPFSSSAWAAYLQWAFIGDSCTAWPTSPTPVLPPRTVYPAIPMLALTGNMDAGVPSEYVRFYASRYPNSTLVNLNGRGHISSARGDVCAASLIRSFVSTLDAGDTACAATPEVLPLATANFPRSLIEARAASVDRSGVDVSTARDRRAATIAVAAMLDALKRLDLAGSPMADVGLRGGAMSGLIDDDGNFQITLTNTKFTDDTSVSGTATWSPFDFSLTGTLTLSGVSQSASFSINGAWRLPGGGPLQVRGASNGRSVALLVPAT
jgi:pimeloyl-ACP methyl ester carboxylesterase